MMALDLQRIDRDTLRRLAENRVLEGHRELDPDSGHTAGRFPWG